VMTGSRGWRKLLGNSRTSGRCLPSCRILGGSGLMQVIVPAGLFAGYGLERCRGGPRGKSEIVTWWQELCACYLGSTWRAQ